MNRRILLPTDFSDNAWSAIVYTLKLYADKACTFYLLNSIALHASTMSSFSNSLLKIMKEDATRKLLELKTQIETSDTNPKHKIELILSMEDVMGGIRTAVIKKNIDLVVMGTKGATGAKELVFGSNTVKAIKKLKICPLLVIPDEYDFVIPKQIAFPTDFNRFYGDKELRPIKELSKLYDSQIRILHINVEKELTDLQEYNYTKLNDYLKNYNHSFHWMPDYDKKAVAIKDFIKELNIDMLAMVNYKHSLIEKIIKEPVIKKIGCHPSIPFFIAPA